MRLPTPIRVARAAPLALVLCAGIAHADVPAPPSPSAAPSDTSPPSRAIPKRPATPNLLDAKRFSDQGAKLMKAKLFEPAATAYTAAYAAGGRAADLRQLAEARKQLGAFALAYEADEALLANHAAELTPRDKAAIARDMTAFEPKTALLDVRVTETGAAVLLDDAVVGTTPLPKVPRVDEGRHVLRVTKRGFLPFEAVLTAVAKQPQSVEAKLEAIATQARVSVREKAGLPLTVVVDDKEVGPAPWTGAVEAGDHVFAGRSPTVAAPPQTIRITPSRQADVQVVLEGAALTGHVVVAALDQAPILVDAKPVGNGHWEGDLPAGDHEIVVIAKGDQRKFRTVVSVESGKPLTVDASDAGPSAEEIAEKQRQKAERDAQREHDRFYGLYGGFSVTGGLPLVDVPPADCPATLTTCTKGTIADYGLLLQLGYRMGFVGIDLTAGFLGDTRADKFVHKGDPSPGSGSTDLKAFNYTEDFRVISWGGYAGLGPRFMTKGDTFNLSFGVNGGVIFHAWHIERNVTQELADSFANNANATAGGMTADLRLSLGSAPGAKFTIGVLAIADFEGQVTTDAQPMYNLTVTGMTNQTVRESLPAFRVANGAQFFVGPVVGLQFGR